MGDCSNWKKRATRRRDGGPVRSSSPATYNEDGDIIEPRPLHPETVRRLRDSDARLAGMAVKQEGRRARRGRK